jgi:hypothetical protein
MGVLLAHGVWVATAWAARFVNGMPPPLELDVRFAHLLLPALDPILLERSFTNAAATLPLTVATVVGTAVLTMVLAALSGGVSLLVAVRSAVLDLLRPLLALFTMPGPVLGMLVFVAGVLGFFAGLFSRPVQVLDVDGSPITYGGDRLGIFLLPVSIVAAGLIFGVTSFLLSGPLKVVSDIVRYLGHPEYRARIHAALIARLEDLEPQPVVIVAHSLGSVIAVDSLLAYPEAWSRFPRLRILTCGSPLRRLFQRFFPATYPAPAASFHLLRQTYADVAWTNLFRPLDYVGARLGQAEGIRDIGLPQRYRLHIGYWTDVHLARTVDELVGDPKSTVRSPPPPVTRCPLAIDRFRYGALRGDRWWSWLRAGVFIVGAAGVIAVQTAWVPRAEREHLLEWQDRLTLEGVAGTAELCPQREIDASDEASSYERAVAGVRFTAADGGAVVLEAYSETRPDVAWDEVQKAVFGRSPSSPFVTGLRSFVFLSDPLLEIKACQPVDVRYVASDPRIFRLDDRFHVTPGVSALMRSTRILVLLLLWGAWWAIVSMLITEVLGTTSKAE